jgi:hypothetical protein
MTRQNLPFGRLLRIPNGLDYSFILISALLCWVIGAVTGIVLFAALLWSACIGWFLDNAAPAQVQEVMFQELLAGHTVAPAVDSDCTG